MKFGNFHEILGIEKSMTPYYRHNSCKQFIFWHLFEISTRITIPDKECRVPVKRAEPVRNKDASKVQIPGEKTKKKETMLSSQWKYEQTTLIIVLNSW